jgi:hypothetical protein
MEPAGSLMAIYDLLEEQYKLDGFILLNDAKSKQFLRWFKEIILLADQQAALLKELHQALPPDEPTDSNNA